MRLGLDLRPIADPADRLRRAIEADRCGLWAVVVGDGEATASTAAAALAVATDDVHLILATRAGGDGPHPLTIAEEVAIVDHLSARRAAVLVDGTDAAVDHVRTLLAGAIVEGTALTPPPAQTNVPVWALGDLAAVRLTGDLDADRSTIDEARNAGTTHLVVAWPGSVRVLARHLVPRAAVPDFPQIVADHADRIAPVTDLL